LLHDARGHKRPPVSPLNSPNPALVTQRAAQRLPRLALLLFCAAYVIPGVFGRDPWKNADIAAFGHMAAIADGRTSWFAPSLAGLPADAALLPYWLGAAAIRLFGPGLDPALAARLPFALLLVLVLVMTWYATYHLARTDAALPLPFAFGGEAAPIDYARAIADGAVLALMATLGLLQLGHETTPELVQLAGAALFLYGLACSPSRVVHARAAVLVALSVLAASGAPGIGVALAVVGGFICARSTYAPVRRLVPWIVAGALLAALVAAALGAWVWRVGSLRSGGHLWSIVRQLIWFTWPAWPLALWTLWRWRSHLLHRHIAVPLGCALVPLLAGLVMGGSDRALMLALPALAVLAAFALPTLQRSTAAAIDWFSVFFFSACAIAIWVIYAAVHTGWPAKPAANIARLAPGFAPGFSLLALVSALLATVAWLWLVRWRAGRNRHPLWKSMVLPAGGVALCWLLAMTLWLPLLDYGRSYRPMVQRIARHVPPDACVCAPGAPRALLAALEVLGGWQVDAAQPPLAARCDYLLLGDFPPSSVQAAQGWELVGRVQRPTDRADIVAIYRRAARKP
jgi:4-amino-4-deoxy-L-arabinose transferase-like glycosyltransferase